MNIRFCWFAAFLVLAACSSAPTRYYTLVPATDSANANAAVPFQYSLTTVNVPVQVDQPQIVVRQGESSMRILETERWAAPLADEVRASLSHELRLQMGRVDGAGLAREPGLPHVSLQVDVRRFESVPGRYSLVEAAWSLRRTGIDGAHRSLTCSSVMRQDAGTGIEALVLAHQRIVKELGSRIVGTATHWMADSNAGCQTNASLAALAGAD